MRMARLMTNRAILLLLLCFSQMAWSQDRYMVFFNDKAGNGFDINSPEAFLSERAIQRRQNQNITIDTSDLPVTQSYVTALRTLGVSTFYTTKWMNGVLVEMPSSLETAVSALSFVDRVSLVAPGTRLLNVAPNPSKKENDESDNEEFVNSEFQHQMLGIDAMHAAGFDGEGMLVGVFDSGFLNASQLSAFDRLFSENRVLLREDFTTGTNDVERFSSHGTRVLSVMASSLDGQLLGAAPMSDYLLFVTEDVGSEYPVEEYNWLFAAEKADSAGVDVINTSLGYTDFDAPLEDYVYEDLDGQTAVITMASNLAASKGILLVTSAGNEGNDPWNFVTPPADSESVIAVGGVTSSFERSVFSSFGPTADNRVKPDVAALGSGVAVAVSGDGVSFQSGTSFASPLVAGLATGLWQAFPQLSASELMDIIRQSGNQHENPDNELGYGIPDFSRAVSLAESVLNETIPSIRVYPNPSTLSHFYVAFSEEFYDKRVQLDVISLNGSRVETYEAQPSESQNRLRFDIENQTSGLYLVHIYTADTRLTKRLIKY